MNKAAKAAIKELRELPLERQRLESLQQTTVDDRQQTAIKQLRQKIALVESTIDILSPVEQRILKASYVGHAESIANIMLATNYSDAQINRIKYSALRKYAYARGLDLL